MREYRFSLTFFSHIYAVYKRAYVGNQENKVAGADPDFKFDFGKKAPNN